MSNSLKLTSRARRDVEVLLRYISSRSKRGADSWCRSFARTLTSIENHPESFGVAPEDEDHDETIYQAIFKTRRGLPYRALFVVRDDIVFVIHVRGCGQDRLDPDEVQFP